MQSPLPLMSVSTASHGPPLSRMHTAPTITTRATSMNSYSGGMGHAPRSSHSGPTEPSPATAPASATASASASSVSLSSMSSSQTLVPSRNGGSVVATNNIINQRADASRSLYQICVSLRQRLRLVPGLEQHLNDLEDEEEGEGVDMDPMSSLWRCLRKGYPLMTIYNCLRQEGPLRLDEEITAKNIPKKAAFKFVQACLLNLGFEECFVLTDLFGDDTTGFVKVSPVLFRFANYSSEIVQFRCC
jgi:cell division control protein 24